jgi:hypothetical protein
LAAQIAVARRGLLKRLGVSLAIPILDANGAGGRFGAPKSIASNRMVFVFVGSLSNLGHLRGNQGCSFQN